jgi:hypothetical protein
VRALAVGHLTATIARPKELPASIVLVVGHLGDSLLPLHNLAVSDDGNVRRIGKLPFPVASIVVPIDDTAAGEYQPWATAMHVCDPVCRTTSSGPASIPQTVGEILVDDHLGETLRRQRVIVHTGDFEIPQPQGLKIGWKVGREAHEMGDHLVPNAVELERFLNIWLNFSERNFFVIRKLSYRPKDIFVQQKNEGSIFVSTVHHCTYFRPKIAGPSYLNSFRQKRYF